MADSRVDSRADASPWRLITDEDVTASFGLAADEWLTGQVGAGNCPPVLRLYSYRFCALVGRFQNLANELRLPYCEQRGIPVNRRPTGGGAIVMGPDQLGVALMLPGRKEDSYARAREMMSEFARGLTAGLERVGVPAVFRGKNDLEVDGRKLAGLGVFRHSSGGLLFHASVLVDLDVGEMLRVLNTPFEKITDKEVATVGARTSTMRKETGRRIAFEEVRQAVAEGFSSAYGISLERGALAGGEMDRIGELEREKYLREDWVAQSPEVTDGFGSTRLKTPAGLLDVRVTLAGQTIKAVLIAGDFFAAEGAVAALEAGLRWHSAAAGPVRDTLARIHGERSDELAGIPADALGNAVLSAIAQAHQAPERGTAAHGDNQQGDEKQGAQQQYGCFVNPQE